MYYKRKLCCYNFTVHEQAQPHEAHCYLWSEVDGKRGSNEIGSCLLQYLHSLPDSVTEVLMFSDTLWWSKPKSEHCSYTILRSTVN